MQDTLAVVPPLAWLMLGLGSLVVVLVVRASLREARDVRHARSADKEPVLGLSTSRLQHLQTLAENTLSSLALNEQFSFFVARRNVDRPLDSAATTALQGMPRRVGSKPVARVSSPSGDVLGLAVLLNVRNQGLFTEADHQALAELIEAVVDAEGSSVFFPAPEFSAMRAASEAAGDMLRALDCRLVIYLQLGEASPAALGVALAELHLNALPDKPGQHVARSTQGQVQFLLAPSPQTGRLLLAMDVPRVAEPAVSLGRLFATANALVAKFGGAVQDEAGRHLGEAEIETIRAGLLQRAGALAQAGLAPGGEAALWVFQ